MPKESNFIKALLKLDRILLLSFVFIIIGGLAAWVTLVNMKGHFQMDVEESTVSTLKSTENSLQLWLDDKFVEMAIYAEQTEVLHSIEKLLEAKRKGWDLKTDPALDFLRENLAPWLDRMDAKGFSVFAPDGISIASMSDENIGTITPLAKEANMFEKSLRGEREFIKPFHAEVELPNVQGERVKGEAKMFFLVPFFDKDDGVMAIFALRLDPAAEFTRLVQMSKHGRSYETYLYNEEAYLITGSRFEDQLRDLGLLADDQRSILNVRMVDPGGDMTSGFQPESDKDQWPLTRAGRSALEKESGVDVKGYRDYRGKPVVGAWSWHSEYNFGICHEVDFDEAYANYYYLRNSILTSVGIILFLIIITVWIFRKEQLNALHVSRSLEQSEAKFRLVMDSMDDAIILIDTKGIIRYWPKSAVKMFGFEESKVVGQSVTEVFLTDPFKKKVQDEVGLLEESGESTILNEPRPFVAVNAKGETFPAEHLSKIEMIGDEPMVITVIRNISGRKEAEDNLVRSDYRLREAQEVARLGSWEWDYPGSNIILSDEGFRIFGFEPNEVDATLRMFLKYVHPKDKEYVKEAYHKWFDQKSDFDLVHRIVLRDGTEKTIIQQGRPEFDESGHLLRIFGTIQDVTERVQQEKELRVLSERLQLATQSAVVGVWDWDILSGNLYWDDTMFEVYGNSKETFTWDYEAWKKTIHPEDLEKAQQELQDALDGVKPFHTVFRAIRDDGEIRFIEATAKVEKDRLGRNVRMVGTNLDVTDQMEANQILRKFNEELENRIRERTIDLEKANKAAISILRDANRSKKSAVDALNQLKLAQAEQQKLAKAVESSPAVVMITDQHWNIEYVNPRFMELTGYREDEVIGRTPAFLKTGNQPEEFFHSIIRKLDSGNTWEGELENKKKDGTVFWEYALFSPIYSEEGELTNYVAVKEDITKRKEAQRKIEEALLQVEMASNAKSEFLANMSHEIRTPMNAILGFTEILDKKLTDSTHRRYLNSIKSSGRLLLNLINDILDLSKVEAGKLEMSYAPVDFSRLINDMQLVFAQKAQEKGLEIVIEISEKMPPVLVLDETRLRQVLINLVGNAIKFTEDGYIKLSAYPEFNQEDPNKVDLVIAVKDTGIGIPENDLQRIFEAFEQVKDKHFTNQQGTGLGLAITSNLVDLMNGGLVVQSVVDKGSTFTVTLHDVEISEQSTFIPVTSTGVHFERVHFEPAKILLADDIQHNRDLIKGYFDDYPFEILEAENGEVACQVARENMPDVILMDMKMPVMNGAQASELLKEDEDTGNIPIIALTASAMKRSARKISDLCDGYLQKPISKQDLVEALSEFLSHSVNEGVVEDDPDDPMMWDLSMEQDEINAYQAVSVELQSQASQAEVLFKTMPMDKLEDFAVELENFATEHSLTKLKDLSASLKDQVLMFELKNIKVILNLITELSKKVSN